MMTEAERLRAWCNNTNLFPEHPFANVIEQHNGATAMAIRHRIPAVMDRGQLDLDMQLMETGYAYVASFGMIEHDATDLFIMFLDNERRMYDLCWAIIGQCTLDGFDADKAEAYVKVLLAALLSSAFTFGKLWRTYIGRIASTEREVTQYTLAINVDNIVVHLREKWSEG